MSGKYRLIGGFWLAGIILYPAIAMPEQSSHSTHVHGMATLNAALDSETIFIEFQSPAINLMGFEHAPATAAQKALLQSVQHILSGPEQLFSFIQADCRAENVEILLPGILVHHNGLPSHDRRDEHADIQANYQFRCLQLLELKEIKIGLFTLFPGIDRINVQWITDRMQGAAVLTPEASRLKIE